MKLIRTIQLDASDLSVFARAATPGEWAVSGAFMFWEQPADMLAGKDRQAFRNGFLGIASLGWSTFAIVSEASAEERAGAVEALALKLVSNFGAPSLEMARDAAEQEIAYAEHLAEAAVGTLVAVERSVEDGEIRERFRTVLPTGDAMHNRAFEIVPDEGESNLAALVREAKL